MSHSAKLAKSGSFAIDWSDSFLPTLDAWLLTNKKPMRKNFEIVDIINDISFRLNIS